MVSFGGIGLRGGTRNLLLSLTESRRSVARLCADLPRGRENQKRLYSRRWQSVRRGWPSLLRAALRRIAERLAV
jgi:hypothetical protein